MVLKKEITHQIKEILKENPQGLSITDIVKAVNINRNTAGRYLENLLVSGQVEMRRFGMSKIYQLSHRVPLSAILSLSSELVMQLDSSLRIVFANEPFLSLVGTDSKNLLGKNIEYTPVALVFDEAITGFIENIKEGIAGKEWSGEIALSTNDTILFCRIAPTVFENGRRGVSVIFEDVTHRKRAEMSLLESEAKLRSITDNSPDMILLLNPKLEIVFISQTYTLTSDQVCGRLVYDFIPQEFHAAATACFKQVLKTGKPAIYGTEHHFANGNTLYFESTVGPVFGGGRVSALVINARDITERKRAEKELQKSEARYRTIFENTGAATIQIEENTIISLVNSEFERLSGFSKHEIEGKKSWMEFVVKEDLEGMLDMHRRRMERQVCLKTYEFRFITKSGDIRNIYLTIDAIPGLKKSIASLLDITDRKCAENALRESEGKLTALLESITDIMSMMDKDLTILWVNEPAKRYFGKNIVGRKCYEVFHLRQEPCKPYPCPVLRAFRDGKTHHHEVTLVDNHNGRRVFEGTANVALRDNSGNPVAVMETAREITEKKKAEVALHKSEAISRALINAPTDSVILMDSRGIILALNETAALRFGKKSNELVGVLADDLLPEELAHSRRSLISQVLENKTMVRFEDERDGRWFDTVAYPVINETGEVTKVAIIARDITYRRNIEEALMLSEQRFRNLITAIGDIIWETDAHTRFVYVSPRVEALLGYKPDELIGHTPFEFLPQEAIAPNQKILQTAIERHERSVIQLSHWMHKDGKDILFESYVIPMYGSDSSFLGFIGIDRRQ